MGIEGLIWDFYVIKTSYPQMLKPESPGPVQTQISLRVRASALDIISLDSKQTPKLFLHLFFLHISVQLFSLKKLNLTLQLSTSYLNYYWDGLLLSTLSCLHFKIHLLQYVLLCQKYVLTVLKILEKGMFLACITDIYSEFW